MILLFFLNTKKLSFESLQENVDTTTSGGKLLFHILRALAEFERDIIREMTIVGLSAARVHGRKGEGPKAMDAKKITMAKALFQDKFSSIDS